MQSEPFLLHNGGVTFSVAAAAMPDLGVALRNFLSPYFWEIAQGEPHFRLVFHRFADLPAQWQAHPAEAVLMRKSTAPLFNLVGRGFVLANGDLVVIDVEKATAYRFDYANATVDFYASESSTIHLFELVRYVALLIEEYQGTLLLHATATLGEQGCYLVLGNKGAGKTTTMLHLVLDHGQSYFSGDKVLLSAGLQGGIVLRGWPDYPHVGVGTLLRFRGLAQACGVALHLPDGTPRPASDKVLIEPTLFRRALHCTTQPASQQVAALIFPRVAATPTQIRAVDPAAKQQETLEEYIEHPHQFETTHWHRLCAGLRRTVPADPRPLLRHLLAPAWLAVTGVGEIPAGLLERATLQSE